MFFTNLGKVYWLKVHELPQAGRATRGRAIVNLLECEKDEKVRAFLNIRDFTEDKYVIVSTKNGTIKKTKLDAYSRPRRTGIIAVNLQDGDDIIGVDITNGEQDIILGTRKGKAIRFNEAHVRNMGRSATGVRGVTLDGKDDAVVEEDPFAELKLDPGKYEPEMVELMDRVTKVVKGQQDQYALFAQLTH